MVVPISRALIEIDQAVVNKNPKGDVKSGLSQQESIHIEGQIKIENVSLDNERRKLIDYLGEMLSHDWCLGEKGTNVRDAWKS